MNENLTLFIMLDGLRPDALHQCDCPTLQGLIRRGSSTLQASSVMPSVTLPCHMSIFHSVPPSRHGITDNSWRPMARPVIGLMEAASDADKRNAFFYNWEELRDLDCWIVDALRRTPHPTHSHLEQTLEWIACAAPKQAVLTNMHIDLDYATVAAETPDHVVPAYDGMTLHLPA